MEVEHPARWTAKLKKRILGRRFSNDVAVQKRSLAALIPLHEATCVDQPRRIDQRLPMNGEAKAAECAALQMLARISCRFKPGEASGVRRIPPLLLESPGRHLLFRSLALCRSVSELGFSS